MGLGTGLKLSQKIVTAWTKTGTSNNLIAMKPVKINIEGLKLAPSLEKKPKTILNIKSGLVEPIKFSKLPKAIDMSGINIYSLSAYNANGERIGELSYKIIKDRKTDIPKALYIKYFGTSGEYKGIGTEMVRQIVQLSNRLGLKGKIELDACTGSIPPSFRFAGLSDKCKVSAAIKYKKMGFVADSKFLEKYINEEIAKGKTGIVYDPKGYDVDVFGTVPMHLSEEAIKKYLSFKSLA